jgi:P-type Cu+ transporter
MNEDTGTKTKTLELDIEGMDCPSCALKIEKRLNKLEGINFAKVDLGSETATIKFAENGLGIDTIKDEIDKLGYKAFEQESDTEEAAAEAEKLNARKLFRYKIITAITLSVIVVLLGMKDHISFLSSIPSQLANWISLPLSTVVVFWSGAKFIKGFLADIRARAAGMDSLIAIGTLSAYFYSIVIMLFPEVSGEHEHMVYFESAAMIITFILLGNYLEFNLKNKTQYAIKSLMNLQAKNAVILREGREVEIPIRKVKPGDLMLVKPGSRIPVDGIVLEGTSSADEAMMTGESLPVDKSPGSNVIGGTISLSGFLKVKAERSVKDSFLSQIITMVKDAQKAKPKIQRIADKVSSVFVPIVIVIAIGTFIVWNFAFSQTLSYSLLKAVAVLIIACPCALGLATPIAIVLGVGKAAENKILFNNAEAIENINKIDTVVFDKTGTLTTGKFEVTEIISSGRSDESGKTEVLKLAASVENLSEHPIAQAIVEKFRAVSGSGTGNSEFYEVSEFKTDSGIGIEAKINDKVYKLGGANLASRDNLLKEKSGGMQNIYLFENDEPIAEFILKDSIKHNAKTVVADLKDNGYKVSIISGDSTAATKRIADELGITDYHAQVLPGRKQDIIAAMQADGNRVAMAGDGINDAPALTKADLGIAIGTGQDIAIQSADVILVKGDLEKIPAMFKISKKTIRIIKQNLFWAFFYNAAAIPVAAGVFVSYGLSVSPVMASMIMAFSDVVTVVFNSMRLKYMKVQ